MCHGGVRKKAGLSFLFPEETFQLLEDGKPAIIKGQPDSSKLMQRIRHHDPEERMPQKAAALSVYEIDLFKKWIEQGAQWGTHWAFIHLQNPSLPGSGSKESSIHPIDKFIQAELENQGLHPNAPADKEDLIRRLYLDLIGLPPSISEVDAFEQNKINYEQLVDQLLSSPRFGEKNGPRCGLTLHGMQIPGVMKKMPTAICGNTGIG